MAKDAQLIVRLESKQKTKWMNHAEAHDQYRDLTNLIEQSVEKQIAEDSDDYSEEDTILDLLGEVEELRELVETVETRQQKLEDLQATSMQLDRTAERLENYMRNNLMEEEG